MKLFLASLIATASIILGNDVIKILSKNKSKQALLKAMKKLLLDS